MDKEINRDLYYWSIYGEEQTVLVGISWLLGLMFWEFGSILLAR